MPSSLPSHWRKVRTSLGFQVATFTFWYWRFDALADQRHFTELLPDQGLVALPPEADDDRSCFIFPSHPVSAPPPAMRSEGKRLIYTPKAFPNYFVDLELEGGFEQYLKRFSSKSRSTLKRKVRRFAEAGGSNDVDCRVYRLPDEMEIFFRLAGDLSARTYQARLLDSGLPISQTFRAEVAEQAATGGVRGFLLFLDQKPVAYVFSFCRDGVATYDYVGHDPQFNPLSPGTVLQYKILENLFEDPDVRIFDFTEGEGEHKALFATGQRLCAKSIVFPKRSTTLALTRMHWLLGRANGVLDDVLERLSLKQKLRRLIRRGKASASQG